MKLALFQKGADIRPGVITERGIVDIADAVSLKPTPQLTMAGIIDGFDALRPALERRAKDGPATPLENVWLRPPLHEHPNEEQFSLVIAGQTHFVLGEEDRVVGPGTLIHIPRGTRHRSRPVNGPATFITIKSPCGNGDLAQDYKLRPEAKEIEALYPGKK